MICCTRTSGDDPNLNKRLDNYDGLYPHKRGWSWEILLEKKRYTVVPAQAGMILYFVNSLSVFCGCTRTSGDDPILGIKATIVPKLYPHKRGWSFDLDSELDEI